MGLTGDVLGIAGWQAARQRGGDAVSEAGAVTSPGHYRKHSLVPGRAQGHQDRETATTRCTLAKLSASALPHLTESRVSGSVLRRGLSHPMCRITNLQTIVALAED